MYQKKRRSRLHYIAVGGATGFGFLVVTYFIVIFLLASVGDFIASIVDKLVTIFITPNPSDITKSLALIGFWLIIALIVVGIGGLTGNRVYIWKNLKSRFRK